jgi:fatty acid CoA ligase FadD36
VIGGVVIADPSRWVEVGGVRLDHHEFYGVCEAHARVVEGISRVAVLARPTMETVVAVMSAMTAGVEVVPVPPDSGVAELRHILSDSKPVAWFGEAPIIQRHVRPTYHDRVADGIDAMPPRVAERKVSRAR